VCGSGLPEIDLERIQQPRAARGRASAGEEVDTDVAQNADRGERLQDGVGMPENLASIGGVRGELAANERLIVVDDLLMCAEPAGSGTR